MPGSWWILRKYLLTGRMFDTGYVFLGYDQLEHYSLHLMKQYPENWKIMIWRFMIIKRVYLEISSSFYSSFILIHCFVKICCGVKFILSSVLQSFIKSTVWFRYTTHTRNLAKFVSNELVKIMELKNICSANILLCSFNTIL